MTILIKFTHSHCFSHTLQIYFHMNTIYSGKLS